MGQSGLEEAFLQLWRSRGGAEPEREFRFAPPRRWRADFYWGEPVALVVEITGGLWVSGRHSRGGKAQVSEIDKRNAMTLRGIKLLEFSTEHLRKDPMACVEMVLAMLEGRAGNELVPPRD